MQGEHLGARRAVGDSEAGFTLIELMMVILIISILIAVLVPTFAGARDRANDRATQVSLRNGLTAAKAVYVDGQDYNLATPARLNAEGIPVKFVDGTVDPVGQNEASVFAGSDSYIVMSAKSRGGSCFYLADDELGVGTRFARLPAIGGCAASAAPVSGDPAWKTTW